MEEGLWDLSHLGRYTKLSLFRFSSGGVFAACMYDYDIRCKAWCMLANSVEDP